MSTEVPINAEPKSEVERLREEVAFLKTCGVIELAARNPNVMEYMRHWEGRAEKAEAELSSVTMWAEVVTTYEGDGVEWRCHEEGGSDPDERPVIELAADTFPLGTKIEISEPSHEH